MRLRKKKFRLGDARKRKGIRRDQAGPAAEYIEPFALEKGDKVVIACRVSTCQQNDKGNLDGSRRFLEQKVVEAGAKIVGKVEVACSGFDPVMWLGPVVRMAEEHDAIILAESTDRLIRHRRYHSKDRPDLQASHGDLKSLKLLTGDCRLMTVLHPEASPGEVRSFQTKRGQLLKGKRGGRPKLKRAGAMVARRKVLFPKVKQLDAKGHSTRQIAKGVGVPRSTIQRWLNKQ